MALIDKIKAIADAIREKTGSTGLMSLDEMAENITYLDVGSDNTQTYILVDEEGNEIPAVLVDEEVTLTANAATDIRIGTTAVTDEGVVTGGKEIPVYHATEGSKLVTNGSKLVLSIPRYNYTRLQAIICSFNTNMANSVAAEKVAINDCVYPVQSTEVESTITLNDEIGYIDFGITNTSGKPCLIRYFTFKEIY